MNIVIEFLSINIKSKFSCSCVEEVLLENVELILEAFDYLQLPFALKQGIVTSSYYHYGTITM
jgi:hypothetical protein